VSVYADIQSATPIQVAEEIRPEVTTSRTEPRTGYGTMWKWTGHSRSMPAPWKSNVIKIGELASLFNVLQPVIELRGTARPVAPPRIISDEQTEHLDWMDYEYPWTPRSATGSFEGKMDWPEIDMEY